MKILGAVKRKVESGGTPHRYWRFIAEASKRLLTYQYELLVSDAGGYDVLTADPSSLILDISTMEDSITFLTDGDMSSNGDIDGGDIITFDTVTGIAPYFFRYASRDQPDSLSISYSDDDIEYIEVSVDLPTTEGRIREFSTENYMPITYL